MKKLFIIALLLISSQTILAQSEAMYSQYMYNMSALNPAYAGYRDALSMVLLHRTQWVGFDRAPITQSFTAHSPIRSNMGLGLSLINDKIGYEKSTMVSIDYSISVKLSREAKLAFGLKTGLNIMNIDFSEIASYHPDDPAFIGNDETESRAFFGFGLFYYTDKYFVGFSIPQLTTLELKRNSDDQSSVFDGRRKHYYISAGTIFIASPQLKIKPTSLMKIVKGAPIQIDISTLFIYDDKYFVGGMYRTKADFGLQAGLKITKELEVAYSYDWSTSNAMGVNNGGSHEIILRYEFNNNKKSTSVNYF